MERENINIQLPLLDPFKVPLEREGVVDLAKLNDRYPPARSTKTEKFMPGDYTIVTFCFPENGIPEEHGLQTTTNTDSLSSMAAQQQTNARPGELLLSCSFDHRRRSVLGEGSFGVVYTGEGVFGKRIMGEDSTWRTETKVRPIVVKYMRQESNSSTERRYAVKGAEAGVTRIIFHFPFEFISLAILRHPNIVAMFEYTTDSHDRDRLDREMYRESQGLAYGLSIQNIKWYCFMEMLHAGNLSAHVANWKFYTNQLMTGQPVHIPFLWRILRKETLENFGAMPEVVARCLAEQLLTGMVHCHYHVIYRANTISHSI